MEISDDYPDVWFGPVGERPEGWEDDDGEDDDEEDPDDEFVVFSEYMIAMLGFDPSELFEGDE